VTGEEGWEEIFAAHKKSMDKEIPASVQGETFDDILRSIGCVRIVSSGQTERVESALVRHA